MAADLEAVVVADHVVGKCSHAHPGKRDAARSDAPPGVIFQAPSLPVAVRVQDGRDGVDGIGRSVEIPGA